MSNRGIIPFLQQQDYGMRNVPMKGRGSGGQMSFLHKCTVDGPALLWGRDMCLQQKLMHACRRAFSLLVQSHCAASRQGKVGMWISRAQSTPLRELVFMTADPFLHSFVFFGVDDNRGLSVCSVLCLFCGTKHAGVRQADVSHHDLQARCCGYGGCSEYGRDAGGRGRVHHHLRLCGGGWSRHHKGSCGVAGGVDVGLGWLWQRQPAMSAVLSVEDYEGVLVLCRMMMLALLARCAYTCICRHA